MNMLLKEIITAIAKGSDVVDVPFHVTNKQIIILNRMGLSVWRLGDSLLLLDIP